MAVPGDGPLSEAAGVNTQRLLLGKLGWCKSQDSCSKLLDFA